LDLAVGLNQFFSFEILEQLGTHVQQLWSNQNFANHPQHKPYRDDPYRLIHLYQHIDFDSLIFLDIDAVSFPSSINDLF